MKLLNRLAQRMKKQPLVYYLFACLAIVLFLGDGKQSVTDVFGVISVLGLSTAAFYTWQPRPVNRGILLFWAAFLTYTGVRTVFSADIGYSVYTYIRYIEAFCIYYIFSASASEETAKDFIRVYLLFSFFALTCAIFLTLRPAMSGFLPLMNQLYPTFGHNRVVDIVLIGYIFSLLMWHQTKRLPYGMLGIFFFAGTIFSYARAVLILEAVFAAGFLLYFRAKAKRLNLLIIGISCAIICATVFIVTKLPITNGNPGGVSLFSRKLPVFQDIRLEYWRQAVVSFREHPVFGSGPGTFYLESVRLQRAPLMYSWFAHNFILELASDTGITGLVLLFALMIVIYAAPVRTEKNPYNLFIVGALLAALAESCVDFNFNYFVIWAVLWSMIGIRFRSGNSAPYGKNTVHPLFYVSIAVLWIFLFSAGYFMFQKNRKDTTGVYTILCSLQMTCTRQLLDQATENHRGVSGLEVKTIEIFHRDNPEVVYRLARYYKLTGNIQKSLDFYERVVQLDPQTNVRYEEYASWALERHDNKRLLGIFKRIVTVISHKKQQDVAYVDARAKDILPCLTSATVLWPNGTLANSYHAKTVYYVALCLVQSGKSETAREMFRLAANADTGWSNIYLDYAASELFIFNNIKESLRALDMCMSNSNSRRHCSNFTVATLPRASVTDSAVVFARP